MRKKFVLTSLVVALSVSTLFGCSESNNKEQETTQTAAESTESTGNTGTGTAVSTTVAEAEEYDEDRKSVV